MIISWQRVSNLSCVSYDGTHYAANIRGYSNAGQALRREGMCDKQLSNHPSLLRFSFFQRRGLRVE